MSYAQLAFYSGGEILADIQQRDARKLLKIIGNAAAKSSKLNYLEAADLMGRRPPQNHTRTTAQMCDLLDAAACLAGVPLLALVAVREKSGEINSQAWKREYGPRRDAILARSLNYRFGPKDYEAISNALDVLGDRGNRKAWQHVQSLYPGDLLYRRLTANYDDAKLDAIDDLGTDAPDRAKSEVWSYARDPEVRKAVMRRAKGACEYCGRHGFLKRNGSRYLESHHVIALANDGEDRLTNVIALCPNDHREAHFGERSEEIEREMILRLELLNR
jgi:hypothetical protein